MWVKCVIVNAKSSRDPINKSVACTALYQDELFYFKAALTGKARGGPLI